MLAACVLSWPGWLHPSQPNPAFARRVAWAVQGSRLGQDHHLEPWEVAATEAS